MCRDNFSRKGIKLKPFSTRKVYCAFGHILFVFIILTAVAIHANDEMLTISYNITVVDYYDQSDINDVSKTVLDKNVEQMAYLISQTKKETDLLIFPEMRFTSQDILILSNNESNITAIPEPKSNINLCENRFHATKALVKLSCVAKKYNVNILINTLERTKKHDYNTHVVIDRNGVLVGKCRRDILTGALILDDCKFNVDAVNFSLILENDLEMANFEGVNNCIVLTRDYDDLNTSPAKKAFLFWKIATQHGINLLVSKVINKEHHLPGSGIFTPNLQIITDFSANTQSTLLSGSINVTFHRGESIMNLTNADIHKFKAGKHMYCSRNVCCNVTTMYYYVPRKFRVVIFNRIHDKSSIKFCGIVYCETPYTCGVIPEKVLEDPKITIEINRTDMYRLLLNKQFTLPSFSEEEQVNIFEISKADNYLVVGFFGLVSESQSDMSETKPEQITSYKNMLFIIMSIILVLGFIVVVYLVYNNNYIALDARAERPRTPIKPTNFTNDIF